MREIRQPTAGIILAAGTSTRMGRPKQLQPFKGRCLLQWVVEAALGSNLDTVVLVLGHEFETMIRALGDLTLHPRLVTAFNYRFREGQAYSLRAGLGLVKDEFPSVMFLLGDQPFITPGFLDLLLERFWTSEKGICVPIHAGKRGNPTIFHRVFYRLLLELEGDQGGRRIIEEHPEEVLPVEIEEPLWLMDVDSEEDLEAIHRLLP